MKDLKKIFLFVFFLSILSACQSPTLSLSEVKNVPNHVQGEVDPNLKLQSITDGGKGYYIIFHSSGDVEADLETVGEKVIIKLNETKLKEDVVKQYTFYLTTNPGPDVIDVYVNGESTPFDMVTIQ